MLLSKITARIFAGVVASGAVLTAPAFAGPMVTYSWTTTSTGFGAHPYAPTSATFEVPLADVLSGMIPQWDISNIQLTYPGLTFDNSVASSGGFDFAAFVDPVTGAFVYHDAGQGLAVIAFAGNDINSALTFLSITVGNIGGSLNVADQFNALDNGNPDAGWPNSGYWTATFPVVGTPAPEPATWALGLLGFGATGFAMRRSRKLTRAIG